MNIEQLKARAFDLIVALQNTQKELDAVQMEIARLMQEEKK